MKKILMQFAGNLLSKEQMKVVTGGDSYDGGSSGTGSGGGRGCWTISYDVGGGCGNYRVSYYDTQQGAVKRADGAISTSGQVAPGMVTGYNIQPCMT